jgi:hypothetical protein
MDYFILVQTIGYLFFPKLLNGCAIPPLGYIKNLLSSILEGYCLNLEGNQYLIWGNLQIAWVQLFWFELLEGYCLCIKAINSHALPLFEYPIKPFGSITNLLEFEKVLQSLSKS